MRRTGDLWPRVGSYQALVAAARRAMRHKRTTLAAAKFGDRLEHECLRLERELGSGTWRPAPAHTFSIRDPKPRVITAVPFQDRVVHHALMHALEPTLDRRMIFDSYACRKGKGLHRAVRRVQAFARAHPFALRMDVAKFFPSLQHEVVLDSLARVIKDSKVLGLVESILAGPPNLASVGAACRQGLPIGSLVSQWLANLVLDRLDHYVKETLRVSCYARYMDDVVLLEDTRAQLWDLSRQVEGFLREKLRLVPKPCATNVFPTGNGIPFLGLGVFSRLVRIRPANLRRSQARLARLRRLLEREQISENRFRSAVQSTLAHLAFADTRRLRQSRFQELNIELGTPPGVAR